MVPGVQTASHVSGAQNHKFIQLQKYLLLLLLNPSRDHSQFINWLAHSETHGLVAPGIMDRYIHTLHPSGSASLIPMLQTIAWEWSYLCLYFHEPKVSETEKNSIQMLTELNQASYISPLTFTFTFPFHVWTYCLSWIRNDDISLCSFNCKVHESLEGQRWDVWRLNTHS